MRRLVLVGLLALAGVFGQASPVPYVYLGGPGFANKLVAFSYPGSYSSLAQVDFRDFKIRLFGHNETCALRSGHWKREDRSTYQSLDLSSTYYLRRTASNEADSILVLLHWFGVGGSSSSEGIAQVFTLSDGRLRVTQEIAWDTHFDAGLPTQSFDTLTDSLLIRSAHYIPGDAHCCVSAMDVVRFTWDGTRFVQTGFQTQLSEYGRTQGKKLPR